MYCSPYVIKYLHNIFFIYSPMEKLLIKKKEIKGRLKHLNDIADDYNSELSSLALRIQNISSVYNEKIKDFKELKSAYKISRDKYNKMKSLIESYKDYNKEIIKKEYKKELNNLFEYINRIDFEFKISVFKKFDEIKSINCEKFPLFNKKKITYMNELKSELKEELFEKIKNKMSDKSTFNELIFYIKFMIKYEKYFNEFIFQECLYLVIFEKFKYHFLTNRESNRLDKPGWIFDFLFNKYADLELIFNIYKESMDDNETNYSEFLLSTQKLIEMKLDQLYRCDSVQKRNLILHFIDEFLKFNKKMKNEYKIEFETKKITVILNEIQRIFLKEKLKLIFEMNYLKWFNEYKLLCKDSVNYIMKYYVYDKTFTFDIFIKPLCIHIMTFIENLRFINREEIRILCYIYNETYEFREYLIGEEFEARLDIDNDVPEDMSFKSQIRLSKLLNKINNLLIEIAENDVSNSFEKIAYFTFVSQEKKRNVLVELHTIREEYKGCKCFDKIEQAMADKISYVILDKILIKTKFSPEEYLEFREFYKKLVKIYEGVKWNADEGIKSVDALFNGMTYSGQLYNVYKKFYNL